MVSEYGFMSFPSYSTLKPVYSDEDMDWSAELNTHRQHHGNGNNEIVLEIKYLLYYLNSVFETAFCLFFLLWILKF